MRPRTGTRPKRRTQYVIKNKKYLRKKAIDANAQNISLLTSLGRPVTFFLILLLKLASLFLSPPPIKSTASKNFLRLFNQHSVQKKAASSSRPRTSIPRPRRSFSLLFANLPLPTFSFSSLTKPVLSFRSQLRPFPNLSRFSISLQPILTFVLDSILCRLHQLTAAAKYKLDRLVSRLYALMRRTRNVIAASFQKGYHSAGSYLLSLANAISTKVYRRLKLTQRFIAHLYFSLLTYWRTLRLRLADSPAFLHSQISRLRHTLSQFPNQLLFATRRRLTNLASLLQPLFRVLSRPLIRIRLPHRLHRLNTTINHSLTRHRRVHLSLVIILVALASSSTITYYFYREIIQDLPDPAALATQSPNLSTKIFDRHGNLLYKIYKNENRSLISLSDIPVTLQLATIAIEDQDFYEHSGISLPGIVRAIKVNTTTARLEGGSTITQQLVKNTLLTPERTFVRKAKEVILSVLTEFYFSKDEILTMYFNQVPYGGATYGAQEASRMYFHKEVSELNLAESAFLAGLPAAPTFYSPYGTQPEQAQSRQKQVLRRMVEEGYITQDQAELAAQTPLQVHPHQNPIYAAHFVMYVKDYLVQRYGHHLVEQGGLEVITSLDLAVQDQVQQVVSQEVNHLLPLNVKNGAALVTIPKTGEVLAMIGSVNYFDTAQDGQVNVTTRQRQPGSSIKPINYAMALENGFTPSTLIPDTPICYHQKGAPSYCPKNYDNRYHGNVTLRNALANSYNIPAVKTLFQFGVDKMLEKAELMGISTWEDRNRFGLALTLGGGDVKMVDMAVAYGTFSNLGVRVDLNPILEIRDAQGKIIYTSCHTHPNIPEYPTTPCPGTRALDPRVAYQITDILSDNQARTPAFGAHSVLEIPNHQVAVKTGTTNSMRDNWTIGYTQDILVAAWVGNNDNSAMSYIASGITGASPIWNKIITQFLDAKSPHAFSPPGNLAKVNICTLTGTLACNGCPSKEEYFLPGTEPKTSCTPDHIARLQNQQTPTN